MTDQETHLVVAAAFLPGLGKLFRLRSRAPHEGGVFIFDIATVGSLVMMAGIPKVVQQFGDNYLLTRVRTTDGTIFDWQLEVFELQQDGRYGLLGQTIQTRSFPLADIRQALRRRFAGVASIDGDGRPGGYDNDGRIWFAATAVQSC
jgi:hypothetical protein